MPAWRLGVSAGAGKGRPGEDGILNVELDCHQAPLTLLPSFGDHAGLVALAGAGQGDGNARSAQKRDSSGWWNIVKRTTHFPLTLTSRQELDLFLTQIRRIR